jgi:hypothetical protein
MILASMSTFEILVLVGLALIVILLVLPRLR